MPEIAATDPTPACDSIVDRVSNAPTPERIRFNICAAGFVIGKDPIARVSSADLSIAVDCRSIFAGVRMASTRLRVTRSEVPILRGTDDRPDFAN